ncbi:MAG: hypothetical protein SNJ56_01610, partial [Termitinemataceae bacterium]
FLPLGLYFFKGIFGHTAEAPFHSKVQKNNIEGIPLIQDCMPFPGLPISLVGSKAEILNRGTGIWLLDP